MKILDGGIISFTISMANATFSASLPPQMSRRMHVVHIINKGTTSHPLIMGYLIQLFWLSVVYNLRLQIVKSQANRM